MQVKARPRTSESPKFSSGGDSPDPGSVLVSNVPENFSKTGPLGKFAGLSLLPGGHQETGENPPPPSFESDPEEVPGQFVEGTVAAHVGPRRAAKTDPDYDPDTTERGRHGANVGPTRARPPAHPEPEDNDEAEE